MKPILAKFKLSTDQRLELESAWQAWREYAPNRHLLPKPFQDQFHNNNPMMTTNTSSELTYVYDDFFEQYPKWRGCRVDIPVV